MDCPKKRSTEAAVAAGLPDDPLVEILSRVHVKSICRFKCVSKGWSDLIADPLHRKKLPQTLEGFFFMDKERCDSYSCGGCTDGGDGEESPHPFYGFVDVLWRSVRPVDFSHLAELPGNGIGIENTRLLHCCNGLLLFAVEYNSYSSESYIVCNPATKQCVAVPSSSDLTWDQLFSGSTTFTYLLFDPGD